MPQELNRIYVRSDRLNSEAIVEFVRALCTVAREELRAPGAPRVYSLTKIVEISHFNMSRIRCCPRTSALRRCGAVRPHTSAHGVKGTPESCVFCAWSHARTGPN